MFQCHLPHDAFEQHHLIGHPHRIAVDEVDLQLGSAGFVDHRVEVQLGSLGIFVDRLDQVFMLGDGFQAIRLRRGFGAARTARRRGERDIGIGIGRSEIEFQFRRHQRLPAAFFTQGHHPFQQMPRRGGPRCAIGVMRIGKNISCGRLEARRHAQRCGIKPQHHVGIGKRLHVLINIGILTSDRQREDGRWQAQCVVAGKLHQLGGREHLAAQHAVHVRHQAFHFGNALVANPITNIGHVRSFTVRATPVQPRPARRR